MWNFYLCSTWRPHDPNAISGFFEVRLARFEYPGDDKFNMAYMRHNGQWCMIFQKLTLDECIEEIIRAKAEPARGFKSTRFFFGPEKSLNIPDIGVSAYR